MRYSIVALAIAVAAAALPAQEHEHTPAAKLGTVHFPTSCAPAVAPTMDRAVAWLHSFEFGQAVRDLNEVLAKDSACAIAHWGIALAAWTNPMGIQIRSGEIVSRGARETAAARRVATGATERERGYIAAVDELYRDAEHRDQRTRVAAYADAMGALVARQPADTEAKIFYAIALVAAAPPTDKTYTNQLKAGAILEPIYARMPDHPGLAHYIIHAYDVPPLAAKAASAAERYADIAPSAAHALHMPSHTFTRVGQWQQSVNTNSRAIEVALRDSTYAEALHASDYKEYALLQMRRLAEAKRVLADMDAIVARFEGRAVVAGAAPPLAGIFARAASPARFALERRAWGEAAALTPRKSAIPYADAMTWLAKALGAAHLKDFAASQRAIDSLEGLMKTLVDQREAYWAEQVAIQHLSASAWKELMSGSSEHALALMKEAVQREDATEKSAATPGPLAPARELLGDMLMELKRPGDALAEYRTSLTREPNRYWSLEGARAAAAASGDARTASQYAQQINRLTSP